MDRVQIAALVLGQLVSGVKLHSTEKGIAAQLGEMAVVSLAAADALLAAANAILDAAEVKKQ